MKELIAIIHKNEHQLTYEEFISTQTEDFKSLPQSEQSDIDFKFRYYLELFETASQQEAEC